MVVSHNVVIGPNSNYAYASYICSWSLVLSSINQGLQFQHCAISGFFRSVLMPWKLCRASGAHFERKGASEDAVGRCTDISDRFQSRSRQSTMVFRTTILTHHNVLAMLHSMPACKGVCLKGGVIKQENSRKSEMGVWLRGGVARGVVKKGRGQQARCTATALPPPPETSHTHSPFCWIEGGVLYIWLYISVACPAIRLCL